VSTNYKRLAYSPTRTFTEARDFVRENRDEGCICPCCGRIAAVYDRALHATMAKEALLMYRVCGGEWGNWPDIYDGVPGYQGSSFPKLKHWELIEMSPEKEENGSLSGWWRILPKGIAFLENRLTVPKYATLYNNRLLDIHGPEWSVVDALAEKFNYEEMMSQPTNTAHIHNVERGFQRI